MQNPLPYNAVSLKQIILTLQDYAKAILKKWYILLFFTIASVAVAHWYINSKAVQYDAQLSFMTNTDSKSGISSILQLAGQFGLGGNSGGGSAEGEADRILELMASKQIVYTSLLREVTIDNQKDLLFNHYLQLFGVNTNPANFKFTPKKISEFTHTENEIAKQIYKSIIDNNLVVNVSKSGIIKATCTSYSEIFSKVFLEELITTLSNYYIKKTTEQQRQTYDLIKNRVDSLENKLYGAEYDLAQWLDGNRVALVAGSLSANKFVHEAQLKRNVEILNVMYAEGLKNLEIARVSLYNNTPVFQIIDTPALPLTPLYPNKIMLYLLSIIIAILLSITSIVLHKTIKDAMNT